MLALVRTKTHLIGAGLAMALYALAATAAEVPQILPDPDGKPADMSKPVQVFILMGQSNMVGFGSTSGLKAATEQGLYPYLVDDAGDWTTRNDVRNVRVMCSGSGPWKTHFNDWLSGSNGSGAGGGKFGPEIGIGYYLGHVLDAPVLILKTCIGNRSLGYDLLPPSAVGTGAGGKSYEGNKDDPTRTPKEGDWYAGVQYDGDTRAAKEVLKDLNTYYPGAKKFEVAGFFFWQGAKDLGKGGSADNYEENLVHLIKDLRTDFNAPDAPFVCATMGQEKIGGKITDAQLAVDGKTGKYPEFKGNVATFYSNPVSKGGGANGHYGGNAETYMNVGDGMGRAMAELLQQDAAGGKDVASARPAAPALVPSPVDELPRYKVISSKRSVNKVTAKVLVEASPEKVPSDAQLAGIRQALAAKTEHRLLLWLYVQKMNYDDPPWATASTDDDGKPRVRRFDKRLPPAYKAAAETPD